MDPVVITFSLPFCFLCAIGSPGAYGEVYGEAEEVKGKGVSQARVHCHCRLESPAFTVTPFALKIEMKSLDSNSLDSSSLDSSFRKIKLGTSCAYQYI